MDLTLPQRLYLLSYDPGRKRFDPAGPAHRGQLPRAAALAELAIGGRLRDHGGRAARTGVRPPDDPFLAAVRADVSPDRPCPWITAVSRRRARRLRGPCAGNSPRTGRSRCGAAGRWGCFPPG
ncbi:GPP34 family phosphoprotein [Marinitenerispora sediminis]|uniref:GPP34 family phosphoprotein n=1 Tax=Marinitenerispora sediminis TaxID=1931232 RepID=UPI001F2195B2|nr:GPP34 family phosphoprotein [Marinitenerispora sediminis]